jgi:hypothetical protein
VLRAEVGQLVRIVFQNNLPLPCNLQPNGGFVPYTIAARLDGNNTVDTLQSNAVTNGALDTELIAPGATKNYAWRVFSWQGPTPQSPQSTSSWLYMTRVYQYPAQEIPLYDAGLFGLFIVTRYGGGRVCDCTALQPPPMCECDALLPNDPDQFYSPAPSDVDREAIVGVMSLNDYNSALLPQLLAYYNFPPQNKLPSSFKSSTSKFTINGLLWGNMRITFTQGERVRFYITAMGESEGGLHPPTISGVSLRVGAYRVVSVAPYTVPFVMQIGDTVVEHLGSFTIACSILGHYQGGMSAYYTVEPPPVQSTVTNWPTWNVARTYYIQAEVQMW